MIADKTLMEKQVTVDLDYVIACGGSHAFVSNHRQPETFVFLTDIFEWHRKIFTKTAHKRFSFFTRPVITNNHFIGEGIKHRNAFKTHFQRVRTIICGYYQGGFHFLIGD